MLYYSFFPVYKACLWYTLMCVYFFQVYTHFPVAFSLFLRLIHFHCAKLRALKYLFLCAYELVYIQVSVPLFLDQVFAATDESFPQTRS